MKRILSGMGTVAALACLFGACLFGACDAEVTTPCRTNADCEVGTCNTVNNECTDPPVGGGCAKNGDCEDGSICAGANGQSCVAVAQGNCTERFPADDTYRDDDAFYIGLTAPLSGADTFIGTSIADGARLAVDDFNANGGLRGERPIVLVLCDDQGDIETAKANGATLAGMGIQSLVGPVFSGQVLETADGVDGTVADNVLLISPSATNPAITGVRDASPRCVESCSADAACEAECPGLVWRTAASDDLQGKALSKYFASIEELVAMRGGVSRTNIEVAILSGAGAYGALLSDIVRTTLVFNDQPAVTQGSAFSAISYESEAGSFDTNAVDDVLAGSPDAIFLLGTSEVAQIVQYIEEGWAGPDADRPVYLIPDGGFTPELATVAAAFGAQGRIRGTVAGSSSVEFEAFAGEFRTSFTGGQSAPDVFGAAGAYDAIYLLVYSALALGDTPPTADALARGFGSLVVGESVSVGKADLGVAASILGEGGAVDLVGASGSLDFDLQSGDTPSDIQVLCIPSSASSATFFRSGAFYEDGNVVGPADPGTDGAFVCPF